MTTSISSYIYLDSKIRGTALQLARYFDADVFCKKSTVVLYKKYKESAAFYENLFNRFDILHQPIASLVRLPALDGSVVYYPFNAQSNCRVVAERGARHVFVTHGESNKAASCKPIVRLYDYVTTAGTAGVDRYVQAGVFRREEAESARVIQMGDTFVGTSGYRQCTGSTSSYVLYAPTWEGGVEAENYSSAAHGDGLRYVASHARKIDARRLVVQPHPNLGHRIPNYREKLYRQLGQLAGEGFQIILVDAQCNWKSQWWLGISCRRRIEIVSMPPSIRVSQAFADLSALETQLLNDGVDYNLFLGSLPSFARSHPILKSYYAQVGIFDWKRHKDFSPLSTELRDVVKAYYISYSNPQLASASSRQRMQWLKDYVGTNNYWNPPT